MGRTFVRPWGNHTAGFIVLIEGKKGQLTERKLKDGEVIGERIIKLGKQSIESYTNRHNFVETTQVIKDMKEGEK